MSHNALKTSKTFTSSFILLENFGCYQQCSLSLKPNSYTVLQKYIFYAQQIKKVTRGRFHKPIYALRQAFTLCPQLLRSSFKVQKLGAERKSLAQSVNGFMKSTLEWLKRGFKDSRHGVLYKWSEPDIHKGK